VTAAEVVSAGFNNVPSTQLAFTTPAAIGTRVLVAVELYETSTGTAAVAGDISDNNGHTWVQHVGLAGNASTGGVAILSTVATSTITTITLNPGGSSNYGNWAIVRFAGASDIDDSDSATGTSTSPAAPALTSSTTDGFVLAVISTRNQSTDQVEPSGWTLILAENDNSTELAGAIASDEITATGSVTSVFTTPDGGEWFAAALLIKASGAGAQSLTLPHISTSETLYAPTLTPGAVTLTLPHVSSGETLYAPTVVPGAVTVTLPHIATGEVLYEPSVNNGGVTLVLPHIASTNAFHTPTITTGAVSLALPHIPSLAQLYAMTVANTGDAPIRIMGGQTGEGWFGNDDQGGPRTTPVVHTFSPPIPAGYGLVIHQTIYGFTPTDASQWTIDGTGNSLTLNVEAQRAHNIINSSGGSVNHFYTTLVDDVTELVYDMTALPAGDNGRYGHIVFYLVPAPATPFYTSGAYAVNAQSPNTNTVAPGTVTRPTNKSLAIFSSTNRGHTEDFFPVTGDEGFPTELKHTFFHSNTDLVNNVYGAFYNSYTQSGPVAGKVLTSSDPSTFSPVWTLNGGTTSNALSSLVIYNLSGGVSPQTLTLPHISSVSALHVPTVLRGAVTLTLPHIASGVVLHVPAVAPGAVTLTLPHIASLAALFEPLVTRDGWQIVLPHIPSAAALFGQTVVPGPVGITLPHIASLVALYALSLQTTIPDNPDEFEAFIRMAHRRSTVTTSLRPNVEIE
jgi:hypothetical protein